MTEAPKIVRDYVTVGNRQVHYRRAGSGSPLVLLHPAPTSSELYERLIGMLSDSYTVIALDRAGWGNSDLFPDIEHPTMLDYAEGLGDALDALGLGSCVIYGQATGSLVGLEFAYRHPERVPGLVLENLPLLPDEERQTYIDRFNLPLVPSWDGAHLTRLWSLVLDKYTFWPWWDHRVSAWRDGDIPPVEGLQFTIMTELFGSGGGSAANYDAVWDYDPAPAMRGLQVPTIIVGREDQVLFDHLDLYPEDRSESIDIWKLPRETMEDSPSGWPIGWWWVPDIARAIRSLSPSGDEPSVVTSEPVAGRVLRRYIVTGAGMRLHANWREGLGDGARPLVLLHGLPRSAASLIDVVRAIDADRTVIALDLPGFGDSDPLQTFAPTVRDYATAVAEALDAAGIGVVDAYGNGFGGLVALELASDNRIGRLVLDNPPLPTPEERERFQNGYVPDIEPRPDGTHLLTAWYFVRDGHLYWPWMDRTRASFLPTDPPDPVELHAELVQLLKAGGQGCDAAYKAMFAYATQVSLRELTVPVLFCGHPGDPMVRRLDEVVELVRPDVDKVITDNPDDLASALASFLEPTP